MLRGRRVPPNRDLILRTTGRHFETFTASSGSEVDFNSAKFEMDSPGLWFPHGNEITPMTSCRFENCNAKKLKSVHLYMKNISVTSWYDNDQQKQIVGQPNDTYIYTYADQRARDIANVDTQGTWIRNQGLAKKLIRNQADFHTIVKGNVYSRNTTDSNIMQLNQVSWKDFSRQQEFFNKTASEKSVEPKFNLDFLLNVDTPFSAPDNGTKFFCKIEWDLVVATKWRLYGTKDHGL